MNIREIEKLLEKYDQGETTLQEEHRLKEFFRGRKIPDNLKPFRTLFDYFDHAKGETLSDPSFDRKLKDRLLESAGEPEPFPFRPARGRFVYIIGIAAGVLLIIGLVFTFRYEVAKKTALKPVPSDREILYAETFNALMMVSVNLNTGLDQVRRIGTFNKAINNLQPLSKFYQYQPIIVNPDRIK